ncbi:MAG TPA: tRNA (adenosine(37)-N6)-threonylcarbamoyltransferase complex ATPase subunit type 1 TsaE [Chitinophagaceae bacterium]|jgi:tRNA threonylcarbamoyladenosine biosynthesis protein TsaE
MEMIYSLQQIPQAAAKFWNTVGQAHTVAFHGNMGVGKTTFIHALCDELNVKDVVSSPTFSIINEYVFLNNGILKKVFHIDLYRLRYEEEAIRAGVEDCLYSDHLCLIEWPEKIVSILPDGTVHVFMEQIDDKTRKLRIGDN